MKSLLKYLLFTLVVLTACGPANKLRRANRLISKAEGMGAKWSSDTVFKEIQVVTSKIEFDTVLRNVNFTDTITVEKDKVITRVKINTVTKEIFVSTECPPDTVYVKVPVSVKRKIEAGHGFWYYLWRGLGLAVLAFIGGYLTRAMARKQVNINIGKEPEK